VKLLPSIKEENLTKGNMKKNNLILVLICLVIIVNAQDTLQAKQIDTLKTEQVNTNLIQDPYLNMKSFNTIDMVLSCLNVNSNNVQFGDYTLKKGEYYPSSSVGMYIHFPNIFQMNNFFGKGKAIANIKTGFLMDFISTDLIDSKNNELSFSQTFINIPLVFSYRMPLNHGNEKGNKYYKAFSLNFGVFMGNSIANRLSSKGDRTLKYGDYEFGNYLRWGYIVEYVYSALNKEGYGHRFGLRITVDANSVIKFNKEKHGIYPTYISMGVFYNFMTIK
jgi:hypothetical protein